MPKHSQLLAFVLIACAAIFALYHTETTASHTLYINSLQSCQRGDVIRASLNRQADDQRSSNDVQIRFLDSAGRARSLAFKLDHHEYDRNAAVSFFSLAKQDEINNAKLPYYPNIDCLKIIAKPHVSLL
jgi:hypothetical protein